MDDDANSDGSTFDEDEEVEGDPGENESWDELGDEVKKENNPEKLKRELAQEYRDGDTDAAMSRAEDLGWNIDDILA